MKEPPRPETDRPVRPTNWTIIALIAGLILLVVIIAYFATGRNADQDKLTNAQVAATTPPPSHEKLCASTATYDMIKAELFRRAAQVRGTDQAAYDRLASFAVVRMENPVMESEESSTGAVNCSGSLSLDLPPGVAVAGGRRTLMSDFDYTVQRAADGTGAVVVLRNADAIITPLATLVRVEQPAQPSTPVEVNGVAPEAPQPNVLQAPPPTPPAPAPQQSAARPSFNCAIARTRGELAVCADSGLAALDRDMATEYARAVTVSSSDQRNLLRDTARRFYAFRDRCPDRKCIADAYTGRIREIRDVVEGRWQPPQ
jgi:hypothetical protein